MCHTVGRQGLHMCHTVGRQGLHMCHLGVGVDGAGECEPRLLPSGEVDAALPQLRLVPRGEGCHIRL
eukprot:1994882-Pyramimonas_sp.AAC.1